MERAYYKEKLINSYGSSFEKKTQEILSKFYGKKFRRIKPYGNIGDRKNDGYIPSEGKFFQIYGPEEHTFSSEKQAILKFGNDLKQLEEHCKAGDWEEIKEFNFVYNDKNNGVSPELEKFRVELEKNKNFTCIILGIQELMEMFDELSEENQKKLRGDLEKYQNNDYKIYKDLKEKFYDNNLIDKLDRFVFGKQHSDNYFYFENGDFSLDYMEETINKNPYYIFKDEELEKLRIEFCRSYSKCLSLLITNYFPNPGRENILVTTRMHKENVGEEFETVKTKAVWALKTLLRECYKKLE